MIDEKNVQRAIDGDLPSCRGKVNQPMHVFFLGLKDDKLRISFEELGLTRGDCGKYPRKLSPKAYTTSSWWKFRSGKDDSGGKNRHFHALAWLTAKWRVESVSLEKQEVVFVRFK